MLMEDYIEGRIKEFEQQIALISKCREKEMHKEYARRNHNLLYMFHKDEALYEFCLTEFKALKDKLA